MSDSTHAATHDDGHHPVHISPDWMYLAVFAALAVLTVLTWWVAQFDYGVFNDFIALGIACTKATLVVLFFMHVKYAGKLTQMIVVCAILWVAIMFALTLIDYLSRSSDIVPRVVPVPSSIDWEAPAPEPAPGDAH